MPLYINICFGFCLKKSPTNGDNRRVTISAIPIADIRPATSAVLYFRSSNMYGIIKVKFISEKSVNETANIDRMKLPLCSNVRSKLSTIQFITRVIIGRFVAIGGVAVESVVIQMRNGFRKNIEIEILQKPFSADANSFSDSFNLSRLFPEIVAIYTFMYKILCIIAIV